MTFRPGDLAGEAWSNCTTPYFSFETSGSGPLCSENLINGTSQEKALEQFSPLNLATYLLDTLPSVIFTTAYIFEYIYIRVQCDAGAHVLVRFSIKSQPLGEFFQRPRQLSIMHTWTLLLFRASADFHNLPTIACFPHQGLLPKAHARRAHPKSQFPRQRATS